jgi:hypothetical protein
MSLENEINNITFVPMFGCYWESLFNNITYQSHEELMISFQSVLVEPSDCIQSFVWDLQPCVLRLFEFRNNFVDLDYFKKTLKNEWMIFHEKIGNELVVFMAIWNFFSSKNWEPWLYTRIKSLIVWILRTKPAW